MENAERIRHREAGTVESVNLAAHPAPTAEDSGLTGIRKRPVTGPVWASAPGPSGVGGSGIAGDTIVNLTFHGGNDQAVYAYAREDLAWWEDQLGRELPAGLFGENLTTRGVDLTGARVGERWRVGPTTVLEVSKPRIPCQKFAERMGERQWVKRFTARGVSGTYLRVVTPGPIAPGDRIELVERPDHDVTIGLYFRAVTTERSLLPQLLAAGEALPQKIREKALAAVQGTSAP
jgi:MOSC domain-containing protein YiiM